MNCCDAGDMGIVCCHTECERYNHVSQVQMMNVRLERKDDLFEDLNLASQSFDIETGQDSASWAPPDEHTFPKLRLCQSW